MAEKNLNKFFESFLKKQPLFVDKKALQSSYTPKSVPHRKEQIDHLAGILAPALRLDRPSNIFIYGKTGTGKSLTVTHVCNNINEISKKKKIPLTILYLNCKLKRVADTEYRLVAQLIRCLGQDVPPTGLPTDEIYKIFINKIEKAKSLLIIILDEIDQLVNKIGDELLYNFTRLNSELKHSQISLIGISNDLMFTNELDARVKSSLSEEEILFPPYNALQLQSILRQRSKIAFRRSTIVEGVIEKCAAYAAREHGDARRALELLRVSGEIAERKNLPKIEIKHIDEAEEKIEKDRVLDATLMQPKQFKLALYSIISICLKKNSKVFTGEIYEIYQDICLRCAVKPLTQRRLSDMIAEFDMLGIINAKTISKGRYGRTREISLAMPSSLIPRVQGLLKESLNL